MPTPETNGKGNPETIRNAPNPKFGAGDVVETSHARDTLSPLRSHPAFPIADMLASYLGLPRNPIQLLQYFSMAAGQRAVNLD